MMPILLLAWPATASEVDHAGHDFHRHHLAVFGGGTYHEKHSEHGGALALEYEFRFHRYVGIGALYEWNFGIEDDPSVFAIPVVVHPWRGLKLMVGPGWEFSRERDPLLRFGLGWDFHVGENLVLTPLVSNDWVAGHHNTNYGLAVGWGF